MNCQRNVCCLGLFLVLFSYCRNDIPAVSLDKIQVDSPKVVPKETANIDIEEKNELPLSTPSNRVAWQKPRLIIDRFGNDISTKTIADIGAGPTGFFTFYLAQKGAHVIAVDIDHSALAFIEKERTAIDTNIQSRIKTRLANASNPNLNKNEVDGILIVNTIGYIQNKKEYFSSLRTILKENGRVVIVDFKMKKLPEQIAPPKSERVYQDVLEDILYQIGYKNIVVDDQTLEYQYIITADK